MLRLDISWIAKAKNVESAAVYLRERGFTYRETRSLTQPGGIKLVRDSLIQRICEAAMCTPNDLFRFSGDAKSHLRVLNTFPTTQASDLLGHMPQAQIDAIMDKAEELTEAPPNPSRHLKGHLRLNAARLVLQRHPTSKWSFLKSKGFTIGEARKLFDPKRKSFHVKMLFRLCNCFTCLPNDLFDWNGSEAHHLNTLKKEPAIDLQQLVNKMTPEEVREFLKQLSNRNSN
jgi:DNA-binding Xre family transcriptional regulator